MTNDNCRKFKQNQIIICIETWYVEYSRPVSYTHLDVYKRQGVVYGHSQNNQKTGQQHQSINGDSAEPLEVQVAGTTTGDLADGKHAHDRSKA